VEKDISLHGIGDKMTMWIMFGRLANRVPRNPSPKRVRSYRRQQISSEQPTNHKNFIYCRSVQHVIKGSD